MVERFNVTSASHSEYSNGTIVEVTPENTTTRTIPGEVAIHEATHAVAAGEIVWATIIPEGNTLGQTQPVDMTLGAAAAAEAWGCSGTGYDIHAIVEGHFKTDIATGVAAGKAALKGKETEVYETAALLEDRKTIGQKDLEEARENAHNKENGIFPVEIKIILPNGQTQVINRKSFRGEVLLENGLLKFPETKTQEEIKEAA